MEKNYLLLDFDGVLSTSREYYLSKKHYNIKYDCYPFNDGCVKILNELIEIINPIIIVSSDWRIHYTIDELNEIFEWNKINSIITDCTENLWNETERVRYSIKHIEDRLTHKMDYIQMCRASEILTYVEKHKIGKYIAIDDMNLSPWIPNNFIQTPKIREGIKQLGIKEKIIKHFK